MHENKVVGGENPDYRMDDDACRAACAALGATTERTRAALMGIGVNTLIRWRAGRGIPRLDVVDSACERLGISRQRLFPGLAAAPDLTISRADAQDQAITEAAEKIAANWPALTSDQRAELSRIMSAITLPAQRRKSTPALKQAA